MTRLRLPALLLASLALVLPFERHAAWAERSDPQYGASSKTFKRDSPSRQHRRIRRPKPAHAAPAGKRKLAANPSGQPPPASVPVPSPNPEREPEAVPAPTAKPAAAPSPPERVQTPPVAPHPEPKPSEPKAGADGQAAPPANAEKPPTPPMQALPPAPTTPAEELACRSRLKSLGADFTDQPAQADPSGCALPHPLLLTKLSATITVQPGALVNCATAEATARFAQGPMAEAARTLIGEDLVSLDQVSAYVCRPRHGTQRLSEHAFGNAIDFSRFTFSKGTVLDVGPVPGDKGEAFLQAIRNAACGPFKTVLGPGSDADHERHLHLDLAQRRGGATFCQ